MLQEVWSLRHETVKDRYCPWCSWCLARIDTHLCPGKEMILFHNRDLIIDGWSTNETLWSFSGGMLMQASDVQVQGSCCSPCHWRKGDKSLFVTTVEPSIKTGDLWTSVAVYLNKGLFEDGKSCQKTWAMLSPELLNDPTPEKPKTKKKKNNQKA